MLRFRTPDLLSGLDGRIARPDIVLNPAIWVAYAAMFAIYAVATAGIGLLWPGSYDTGNLLMFAASLAAVAGIALLSEPPPIDSWKNHAVIASVYVFSTIGVVAYGSGALIPLGAMLFAGSFAAIRLQSQRAIIQHMLAAGVCLSIPVALGLVDGSVTFAIATMVPSTWVLAYCVVVIWEVAERQGDELEALIRQDPLTGVGNRRKLDECMEAELARHAVNGKPFTVLALDLNGFKALNDVVGHDAGDDMLRSVARALQSVSREQDTVARQGGDEFCVVLPDTSVEQSAWMVSAIRTALATIEQGVVRVTTGIGAATFPGDGTDAETLLQVADARLASDKTEQRPLVLLQAPTGQPLGAFGPSATEPPAVAGDEHFTLIKRLSRRELALNPYTWRATCLMYSVYTVISAMCCLVFDGNAWWAPAVPVVCGAIALAILTREPPATDSFWNHAVLAATYTTVTLLILAFPAGAGVCLGVTVFVGPLPTIRTADRRLITLHLIVPSVIFAVIVALGLVGLTTSLALMCVAFGFWGMGFSCGVILEAAERQGDELEWLVRRDPLTGLGNRRMLSEQLEVELSRHARARRPLTVMAFDLNGFKALNDDVGHAAGDELLQAVGKILTSVSGPDATVVRQGGDEFCILLPHTTEAESLPTANAVRAALAVVDAHGHTIGTGIGTVAYPQDAVTPDELLRIADERLRESKESGRPRGEPGGLRVARSA